MRRLSPTQRTLRRHLFTLLRRQGLDLGNDGLIVKSQLDKAAIRRIHFFSRQERLRDEAAFIQSWLPRISKYLASGSDVVPDRIDPYPILIGDGNRELAALFRIASLWWSVPVSRGFGRRLRFVVLDRANGKLIGLIGLTDPVFNLRTRDDWIDWDTSDREKRLAHVMDAYVLGAVPPYNRLLGAKLLAFLLVSDHVRKAFLKRYRASRSVILERSFDGRLALVTATSALGPSSIYNRLRFEGLPLFEPVGLTEGYGHFHLANGTFDKLRDYVQLRRDDEFKRYRFGRGPNYRMRVVRKALRYLRLEPDLLRHGIQRAVYVAPLAHNAAAFLRGDAERLKWYKRPMSVLVDLWRERWLLPRAGRDESFRIFDRREWATILTADKARPTQIPDE